MPPGQKRARTSDCFLAWPMLGLKAFTSPARVIAGIETMHMIKQGQLHCPKGQRLSAAEQFFGLAF